MGLKSLISVILHKDFVNKATGRERLSEREERDNARYLPRSDAEVSSSFPQPDDSHTEAACELGRWCLSCRSWGLGELGEREKSGFFLSQFYFFKQKKGAAGSFPKRTGPDFEKEAFNPNIALVQHVFGTNKATNNFYFLVGPCHFFLYIFTILSLSLFFSNYRIYQAQLTLLV